MEHFNLKVFRYDPTKDSEPYYQTYKLPVEKGMTVLAALFKAKEEQDPTISFRYNCRAAICGSCAVRINGHANLACKVQITHLLKKYETDTITIDPIGNVKPLKDLISTDKILMTNIELILLLIVFCVLLVCLTVTL